MLPSQRCKKMALDLKKVSTEHHLPYKDYVPVSFLSNACLKMEEIADTIDNTSSKLHEALDGPTSSDVEDVMDEWDWCEQLF
jgi:hypothetical protein